VNCYAIEFRKGSYFRGDTAGQAMRFNQAKYAEQYIDAKAGWVWLHGGMVVEL
jgi:hypothetical protein